MAIARVQAGGGTNGGTSVSAAFSSNNGSGNLLVAAIVSETDGATLTSLTDTRGNTWLQASTPQTVPSKGQQIGIWYVKSSIAGANTVTAVCSAGPVYIHIREYSGLDTASPLDQHAETNQVPGPATPSSPSVTTTAADELLVGHIYNNRGNITAGTGYTLADSRSFNNFSDLEDRIVSATGSYVANGTMSTGGSWGAVIVTFKAGSAGGTAHHLAMATQPGNGTTGIVLPTQPAVVVQDVSNATVSGDTSNVTAALNVVSGSGTLSGTTTKAAVAGVASFTDLKVTGTGTFTITFTDGALTSVTSASFTIASRPNSPYLNLATDGKDIGADNAIVGALTATALSGDRRSVTEGRYGGASQWWSFGGLQRVQYPRTLINSDMPTWTQLQAMTIHNVSGDAALLAKLGGGTLGTGGHVIVVDHTVTYTGNYRMAFPLRSGGDAVPGGTNVVIVISKAIWDSMVANGGVATVCPEKKRVTSADLANLAHFQCDDPLGKFMVSGATKGWRFVGLRFSPNPATTQWSHGVGLGNGDGAAQNIAAANIPSNLGLDRCYIDGHATCTTIHGFELNCAYGYIVDCASGNNIWTVATGESHVICGYNGPGPFRVVNNYINGGTQSFFIGGSPSVSGMPSDIEFRWNHMSRPLTRNPNHPSYDGVSGNYVKNAWEVKAAKYVLAEGNIAERTWYGAQAGSAWLIKAESYGNADTIGRTSDVLVRWNLTRDASMGPNIAGVPNVDPAGPPQRVWIYDNVIRLGAQYFSASENPFFGLGLQQDCGIIHNTCIAEGTVKVTIQLPNPTTEAGQLAGLNIKDNIFEQSQFGWKPDGGSGNLTTDLNALAPGYSIDKNVVIGNNGTYPGTIYTPANEAAIEFEDVAAKNFALHGTTQTGGAAVATALVVTTNPSNATSGVVLSTQPVVQVRDQFGALFPSTATVTASILSGNATITAGSTKVASGGVATFAGLTMTAPSTGSNTIRFSSPGLASADVTITVTVTPVVTSLAILTAPGNGTSGVVLGQQPVIQFRDQFNQPINSAATVTATVASGGATITAGASAIGSGNSAIFSGLTLTKPSTGAVTLTFSAPGLTGVTSGTFTITVVETPIPSQLALLTQPAGGVAGFPLTTQPVVQFLDQFGNPITSTALVTAEIGSGVATIIAGATKAAVSGVAAFTNLTLDTEVLTSSIIVFSSPGVNSVSSSPVAVSPSSSGPPPAQNSLSVYSQPTSGLSGQELGPLIVQVLDPAGVPIQSTALITVSVVDGNLGLSGTSSVPVVNGAAVFDDLVLTGAGEATLAVVASGMDGTETAPIAVTVKPPPKPLKSRKRFRYWY